MHQRFIDIMWSSKKIKNICWDMDAGKTNLKKMICCINAAS